MRIWDARGRDRSVQGFGSQKRCCLLDQSKCILQIDLGPQILAMNLFLDNLLNLWTSVAQKLDKFN